VLCGDYILVGRESVIKKPHSSQFPRRGVMHTVESAVLSTSIDHELLRFGTIRESKQQNSVDFKVVAVLLIERSLCLQALEQLVCAR